MVEEKPSTSMAEDVEKTLDVPADGIHHKCAVKRAHKSTVDEAMKALEGEDDGRSLVLDDATNKRLLRKIDLHIMPLMCIVYGLNYLDKTTLSYANVMGLKKSLDLKGDDYQWLGSMFYFGTAYPLATTPAPASVTTNISTQATWPGNTPPTGSSSAFR